jgi:5-(carboxyamino)imidazole ribonucleotide synthase
MVDLIGRVPAAADVLSVPSAHLRLYDKSPRQGRKLGHVTVRAGTEGELRERLRLVRALVGRGNRRPPSRRRSEG